MTLDATEAIELPPGGERVFSFPPDHQGTSRGGLIFHVRPSSSEPWTGQVFGPLDAGSSMRLIKVWPETNRFLVISNGIAFLGEAEAPTSAALLPVEPVQLVTQAHDDSCIIADFSGLVCVDANGIRWFNNRLHADGFEGIDVQADRVLGQADIPPKGWTRFSLRLQDGRQVTAEPD